MNKFSFEGIGAVAATFSAGTDVKGGQVVKLTRSDTVGACEDGDRFCGLAMEPRRGGAAVQVKGFMEVKRTGPLSVGWRTLAADGAGGVRAAAEGAAENGVAALVVSVSPGDSGTAVICL